VYKLASHDANTDTDILPDILAKIVARMSACRSTCHWNNFRKSRVGRVGEDIRVGVGVGVMEFQLYDTPIRGMRRSIATCSSGLLSHGVWRIGLTATIGL